VAEEFARTGFTPALNWFRNFDRNWALTSPWHNALITQPALYITGDRDLAATLPGAAELIEADRQRCRMHVTRSCCRVAATGSSRSDPMTSAEQ
jgi:hypothetical protein